MKLTHPSASKEEAEDIVSHSIHHIVFLVKKKVQNKLDFAHLYENILCDFLENIRCHFRLIFKSNFKLSYLHGLLTLEYVVISVLRKRDWQFSSLKMDYCLRVKVWLIERGDLRLAERSCWQTSNG